MILQVGHFALLAAVVVIAVSSLRKWWVKKASKSWVTMIGANLLLIGTISMEIAPRLNASVSAAQPTSVTIPMNACDVIARILVPLGFLVFSVGFAMADKLGNHAKPA